MRPVQLIGGEQTLFAVTAEGKVSGHSCGHYLGQATGQLWGPGVHAACTADRRRTDTVCCHSRGEGECVLLLNDREFWLTLLIRDWPRRGLLDRTSEWVHRKCLTTVYSGSLWCHNENAGFPVKFLLRLASLVCIFLWRHNIRTSFRADFCLRLTTPWTFLCD